MKIKSLLRSIIVISLYLFFLSKIVPPENYLTVVTLTISFIGLLTPLYLFAYKINNAIKTPVLLADRLDAHNDKIVAYPDDYNYATIKTATTTTLLTTAGYIREIRVSGGILGKVTVYDNITKSGSEIVPTVIPDKGQVLKKDCHFVTGLTIVTAEPTIVVVSYRGTN